MEAHQRLNEQRRISTSVARQQQLATQQQQQQEQARYAGVGNANTGITSTGQGFQVSKPVSTSTSKPGFMNRTKKFLGGIKQKLSNKMSGVNKVEAFFSAGPKQIILNETLYTLYGFKADKDKLVECTGYKAMNLSTNIKLADTDTLNNLLNKLGSIGPLIWKLRDNEKLGLIQNYNNTPYFRGSEITDNLLTGPIRIVMYATYDISQATSQAAQQAPTGQFNENKSGVYYTTKGLRHEPSGSPNSAANTYMNVSKAQPSRNVGYFKVTGMRNKNPEYMNVSSIRENAPEVLTEIKPETIESQTGQIASTRVG